MVFKNGQGKQVAKMYYRLHFRKVIIRVLLLAVMSGLDSCYSPGVLISKYDLPLPDSRKYHYIIHTDYSDYRIKDIDISDGFISGKADTKSSFHKRVNIYLSSDTIIKISPDQMILVPVRGIKKVERQEVSVSDTLFLTGLIVSVPFAGWLIHDIIRWTSRGMF